MSPCRKWRQTSGTSISDGLTCSQIRATSRSRSTGMIGFCTTPRRAHAPSSTHRLQRGRQLPGDDVAGRNSQRLQARSGALGLLTKRRVVSARPCPSAITTSCGRSDAARSTSSQTVTVQLYRTGLLEFAGMATYETLLVEKSDGIAWVSLNRPQVLNAVNQQMQDELHEVWHGFRYDNDVRCIVLTGEGKSFCTGIDRVESHSESNTDGMAVGNYPGYPTPWMYDDPGRDIGPKSMDCWKPVIAAVQGIACGGAFYMLGEVEFIIAADDATFFDPHVTYGMTAAFEPIQMLRKMPFQEIMRMSLLGSDERMSAERAREIGLVTEVVPRDELRERAAWAARVIADSPPLAIQGTMRALWTALEVSRHQGIELANLFTRIGSDAETFKAGQARFESGQRPKWRLR